MAQKTCSLDSGGDLDHHLIQIALNVIICQCMKGTIFSLKSKSDLNAGDTTQLVKSNEYI